jgi:hypothetical protein
MTAKKDSNIAEKKSNSVPISSDNKPIKNKKKTSQNVNTFDLTKKRESSINLPLSYY